MISLISCVSLSIPARTPYNARQGVPLPARLLPRF